MMLEGVFLGVSQEARGKSWEEIGSRYVICTHEFLDE